MKETVNRTEQSLPSQLQPPPSVQCLGAQPIAHHDNAEHDVLSKERQEPVVNETSYELEKREAVDSDLSDDLDIQRPTGSDVGHDPEKQKPKFNRGEGEAVGDQDEVPAEDPNLVCLPLYAGCGKMID